jgi:hypothetical protein
MEEQEEQEEQEGRRRPPAFASKTRESMKPCPLCLWRRAMDTHSTLTASSSRNAGGLLDG